MSQTAFPMVADPFLTLSMRALARKKRMMSKMKARRARAPAVPDMHVAQHVRLISRTWERRPKRAAMPAPQRAMTWMKRA